MGDPLSVINSVVCISLLWCPKIFSGTIGFRLKGNRITFTIKSYTSSIECKPYPQGRSSGIVLIVNIKNGLPFNITLDTIPTTQIDRIRSQ